MAGYSAGGEMQVLVFSGLFLLVVGVLIPLTSNYYVGARDVLGGMSLCVVGIGVLVFLVAVAHIIAKLHWLGWIQVAGAVFLALVTLFMMATIQNLVLARKIRSMGGAPFLLLASAILIGLGGWLTAKMKPPTSETRESLAKVPVNLGGQLVILPSAEEEPPMEKVLKKKPSRRNRKKKQKPTTRPKPPKKKE